MSEVSTTKLSSRGQVGEFDALISRARKAAKKAGLRERETLLLQFDARASAVEDGYL